ncbi:hypothetical protein K443DRAFT_475816 [Laccaria amethystina LaAM-08-1]|uniref:Uncharacterized protein n=1 Tax=Laccaria amethystina LaAM-08-1 TaxID=1095629 RepID=A0A0C9Y5T2_9AGAR|nr:hypothetical protein K443DRAFT_475816 [Laccaria amethystina LaAM-08-1]
MMGPRWCFDWALAPRLHEFTEQRASLKSFLQIKQLRQILLKSEYHTRRTFSRFRLYNPYGVTISRSQRPDWLVHR